ncbi:porphobilinogen synthase [Verrucomicrobium sp. GAS474]|uniref:porphobilinogen synthase n=1 Tax=Verrucomicrobium sp. GAS474 TaxID=1882831 RepID=UPI000879A9E8|nr:porphobilinogen synthase [Verrucomicrobium sp. GAS474]SDT85873.1 porphobilinogen synthase [Verrucomicrobium sp. GAS474]
MPDPFPLPLARRPRRLRQNAAIRAFAAETELTPGRLVAPLFIRDVGAIPETISSMPGVKRHLEDSLLFEVEALHKLGIGMVALFPSLGGVEKDDAGSAALDPTGLIPWTVARLKKEFPDMAIMTDLALDPFTTHGHDGIWDPKRGDLDNDATVAVLAQMGVIHAQAGADFVAPSDMMDGRVGAIRSALDEAGLIHSGIVAYSAKFASAYYGPFREAVGSGASTGGTYLDKRTYQLNPANRREAVLEALLDEEEGADVVMVKPAGPYLDIVREVREAVHVPVAAYQVSGEYAQIVAAGQAGWIDLRKTRDESLLGIRRAGADLILTYFAREWAEDFARRS